MSRITRRRLLGTAAGAGGSLLAYSLLGRGAFAQDARIRHFWWGNPERDRRTLEVIAMFNEANPGIEVVGETLGFNDYFTRLTTQIAGGNMADVIQMGLGVMQEYVDRGTLLPLDEYIGNGLDLSDMDQSAIDAGTFNGQLYGISIGANSMVSMFNTRLFEEAGVEIDPVLWTYDDLKAAAVAITEATPDGVYGTDDATADWGAFGTFISQKGYPENYTEDGMFAFNEADIVEYWTMWKDMRDARATPPGAESAGLVSPEMANFGIVTGLTAITYAWSNQMVGVQDLVQDKIGAAMRPHLAGGEPGQSIQPSQFISLTRDTVDAEAAIAYMSAFVNDPAMTRVLGLERGIPSVGAVRDALQPDLNEIEQTTVAYFDAIQDHVAPIGAPEPPGNRECEETFERLAVNVLLERQSIEDTAAQFYREGTAILRRAQ
jgi:multiple sugar transport system substrate-binding protein